MPPDDDYMLRVKQLATRSILYQVIAGEELELPDIEMKRSVEYDSSGSIAFQIQAKNPDVTASIKIPNDVNKQELLKFLILVIRQIELEFDEWHSIDSQ